MNLIDVVGKLSNETKSNLVSLPEWDYELGSFVNKNNPRFLYRGENAIYPSSMASFHRIRPLTTDQSLKALCYYMADLTSFLIDEFLKVVSKANKWYEPRLNQGQAFMQHYGFPVRWIDFTESISVAAYFASLSNTSGKGRIWIIDTKKMVESGYSIYKLQGSNSKRPNLQKAWSIYMPDDKPDLQIANHYPARQITFDVTKNDINYFDNKSLLNTNGDKMCDFIIDYIQSNPATIEFVQNAVSKIKSQLISDRFV